MSKVEFYYREGSPPQAIGDAANELSASVVVMGPARHNSLEVLPGNRRRLCVRHYDHPVLIVKHRPHRAYDRIVVARSDFSAPSASELRHCDHRS